MGKRDRLKVWRLPRQGNESSLTELTRAAGIGKLCKQMGPCCVHTLPWCTDCIYTESKISLKTMSFHNFPVDEKIAFHHFYTQTKCFFTSGVKWKNEELIKVKLRVETLPIESNDVNKKSNYKIIIYF